MSSDNFILLISNRADFKSLFGLNLNIYLGAMIVHRKSLDEAVSFLDENECQIILADNKGRNKDIGHQIWEYLNIGQKNIPLFILGKSKAPINKQSIFPPDTELKSIIKSLAKTLGITAKNMFELEVPDYYPIHFDYLTPGWQCACMVYRKNEIIDDEGNVQEVFEEIFDAGEIITHEKLQELEATKIKVVHVKSKERLLFANSLTNNITEKLSDPNLSDQERLITTAMGYQMISQQARKMGISESTFELSEIAVDSMKKSVEKAETLSALLKLLVNDDLSFRYRLSLLTGFIGGHIISKMQWGTTEQQEKFIFVSFFADIVLTKDEFVKIRSDEELEALPLCAEDKKLIQNHALYAAKLVAGHETLPLGAETIIKQHHGCRQGNKLSQVQLNISPLAVVFILAQELAFVILQAQEENNPIDQKSAIKGVKEKYNMPVFKKIIPILDELSL